MLRFKRKLGTLSMLFKIVFINIAIFIFLLGLIVVGLPLTYDIYQLTQSTARWDYSTMPNFKNHAWAKGHFEEYSALKYRYYDYIGWRNLQFKGTTLNTDSEGYRRHSKTEHNNAEIWIFGGSAILGPGARDSETIPAFLEHLSNKSTFNFGESGYVSHQSLNLLQKVYLQGGKPRKVIFYDGVNDTDHKCSIEGDFYSSSLEKKIRRYVEDGRNFESGILVFGIFRPFLIAYQKFFEKFHGGLQFGQNTKNTQINQGDDCTKPNSIKLNLVAKNLVSDWVVARRLVESNGGVFFPILQPVVFLGRPNISNQPRVKDDIQAHTRYELVYNRVKKQLDEMRFKYYDFTRILDAGSEVENKDSIEDLYYYDRCHLSPNGNERVASRLLEIINN